MVIIGIDTHTRTHTAGAIDEQDRALVRMEGRVFEDYKVGGGLLADVDRFAAPVPARGKQGLWTWDERRF